MLSKKRYYGNIQPIIKENKPELNKAVTAFGFNAFAITVNFKVTLNVSSIQGDRKTKCKTFQGMEL